MLQQLHDSVIAWVRHGGGCAWTAACHFLDQQAILTLSWDQHQADGAARAYAQFGRSRHPSGLNFGDCFSYALAQHLQVPLLFVGNDFRRTDLIAAL